MKVTPEELARELDDFYWDNLYENDKYAGAEERIEKATVILTKFRSAIRAEAFREAATLVGGVDFTMSVRQTKLAAMSELERLAAEEERDA